jgi:hypothetical protein
MLLRIAFLRMALRSWRGTSEHLEIPIYSCKVVLVST